MDGKTVSNEEKYFEIFERLKNVGFRKEIQAGCKIVSLEILWLLGCDKFRKAFKHLVSPEGTIVPGKLSFRSRFNITENP